MQSLSLNRWEKVLILFSLLLFLIPCGIYVTDFPLIKYLFNLPDEDGQRIVGLLLQKGGVVRRQINGKSEFEWISANTALYNLDIIVTGPDSEAKLKFDNGGSAELAANTMVRLAFQSESPLDAIVRDHSKLEVIAGTVTGTAGKHKLLIASEKKVVTLLPPPVISKPESAGPITTTQATPTPPPPEPLPIPTPTPTVTGPRIFTQEEAEQVKIRSPSKNEILAITPYSLKPEKEVTLVWKMNPPNGKTQVTLWKDVASPSQTWVTAKQGEGRTPIKIKTPGTYEWKISGPEGEAITTPENSQSQFSVAPSFLGIRVLSALVGGHQITSNRLDHALLTEFNVTLRWEPYPGAKKYKVWFAKNSTSQKSILEKTTTEPQLIFNKDKIFKEQIYYKVLTELESGFLVFSELTPFAFNFLPPAPVSPPHQTAVTTRSLLLNNHRLLLTWEKTNFTLQYELEISRDPNFAQIIKRAFFTENYYTLNRPPEGTYWWRVRSITKDLSSPMSLPFSFTVIP